MSDKQPIYNRAVGRYQYLPTTPPKNKEFYVVDEASAERAFADWKDITKTTNERRFESYKNKNQRILKFVYGGSGTSADLLSSGYSSKYGPVTVGGVQVKEQDVSITPGTKEYFEFTHYNGQPKKQREEFFEKKKRIEERKKIKEEEKLPETEIEQFEAEVAELKKQRDIANATGKTEISKVLKDQALGGDSTGIEIGTSLDDSDDDILKNTSLNEKDLSGGGGGESGGTQVDDPPITTEKPKEGTKVPPIIINHAECGHLTFGDEKKNSARPRDVGLYGGDSQKLRLFRDGGFELCSSESQGANLQKGSLINQVCDDAPLSINSEGDIIIRAKNKLILEADLIEIESTNKSEDGVTIMAEHDIKLRANNNTIITSDNITIDAHERIVSHSEGWTVLIGQYIRLHEPQTKICPAFLEEYIDNQIKTLKN